MKQKETEWKSMRETVRQRILKDMFMDEVDSTSKKGSFRVLVLDKRATSILDSVLRTYDITKDDIALIESLEVQRQPFPELDVVYFVEPTKESIDRIVLDFSKEKRPMYGNVHIFLTRHVDEHHFNELFQPITENVLLKQRLHTLTEANIDFLPLESNVFHFDMDLAGIELYNSLGKGKKTTISTMAHCLVSLCATMNEYPYIRYNSTQENSKILADSVQQNLNQLVQSNEKFWFHGDETHGDASMRATLFIVDRAEDAVSPFMHEFTYQAMVNDLLDIDKRGILDSKKMVRDGVVTEEEPSDKTEKKEEDTMVVLGENDAIWKDFKHMHIADIAQRVGEQFNKYANKTIHRYEQGMELSMEEMVQVARDLPEYQAFMAKNALHLKIASTCLTEYSRLQLSKCGDLEQLMATGVNSEGKEVSGASLTAQMVELIADPAVNVESTIRLLALYIITQKGIKEADRRSIIEAANPPLPVDAQNTLTNLKYLGVTVESATTQIRSRNRRHKDLLDSAKRLAKNCDYSKSRYIPMVQELIDSFCTRKLTTERYPYVFEPPPMSTNQTQSKFGNTSRLLSVRTQGTNASRPSATWTRNSTKTDTAKGPANFEGGRIIVFFSGGVTYSEIRAMHEVMKEQNREVIIGSSHIIRPRDMIDMLKVLDDESAATFFNELKEKEEEEAQANFEKFQKSLGLNQEEIYVEPVVEEKPAICTDAWFLQGFKSCFGSSNVKDEKEVELPNIKKK